MPDFIFERDGQAFVPTRWAGSPWSPDAQHGGPVAGLFMRDAEEVASEGGLRVARLTLDLFRSVPKRPVALARRVVRRGRRLTLLDLSLACAGEEVARASALLLAPQSELASALPSVGAPPPPAPEVGEPFPFMPGWFSGAAPPGFHESIECRMTRDELGPAAWLTTPLELVAGEETSPSVRFAALSDLTFAMGGRIARGLHAPLGSSPPFINADLSLYRERAPQGEWLAFRLTSLADQAGLGVVEVAHFDRAGRLGRSLQALVGRR